MACASRLRPLSFALRHLRTSARSIYAAPARCRLRFHARNTPEFDDLRSLSYDEFVKRTFARCTRTGVVLKSRSLRARAKSACSYLASPATETLGASRRRNDSANRNDPRDGHRSSRKSSSTTTWSRNGCKKRCFRRASLQAEATRFDAAYRPASDEADVGGDWYDAFELGAGKIGISVGDVTGHGLEAAVAMSEIRRALRAAAATTDSPKALLNYVDSIVSAEGIGMATASSACTTFVRTYCATRRPDIRRPVLLERERPRALFACRRSTARPGRHPGLRRLHGHALGGRRAASSIPTGCSSTIATSSRENARCSPQSNGSRLPASHGRCAACRDLSDIINTDDSATPCTPPCRDADSSVERWSSVRFRSARVSRVNRSATSASATLFSAIASTTSLERDWRSRRKCDRARHAGQCTLLGRARGGAHELVVTVDSFGHWQMFTPRDERGRGIPIMRSCSKRLEISSTHERTRITLTFDR